MRRLRQAAVFVALLSVLPFFFAAPLTAQSRLSDKDLEQRIKNMNDDVKKFRSTFNSSVSKTSIRKTTQEKEGQDPGRQFSTAIQVALRHVQEIQEGRPVPPKLSRFRISDR